MIKRPSVILSEIISFHRYAAIAVVGCACASLIQPAIAINNTWTFNGNGNWDDGPKWSLGIPAEGSGTTAVIDDGDSAVTVTLDSSHSIGALSLGTNDTLLIQANSSNISLSSANDFTNNGTIRLTGIGASGSSNLTGGTVTNSATGLIDFQAGPEDRFLTAELVNNGTVTVNHDVSFNKVTGSYTNNNSLTVASGKTLSMSNASTLNQNGGTFTLNGTLTGNLTHNGGTLAFGASSLLNNTNFSYLGGSITGTVNIRSSTLTLGPGTGAASFFMDQTNTLASDIRAGQTITLQSNDSNISLSNSAGFVNNGTIRYTGLGTSGSTTVNSGGTITNSATGLIDFQAADTEAQYLTGDFVNNGTVTVSHDVSFNKVTGSYTNNNSLTVASGKTLSMSNASTLNQNGGTFTLNGTLTGNLTHNGGTLAFGASSLLNNTNFSYLGGSITGTVNIRSSTLTLGPGTGAASFFMDQTNTLASDIRAGQTITLQSNDSNISLSNSAGFVNNGTIRYTGLGTSGSTTVNSGGTITNSATGLIDFQAADTEAQYLTGDFVNNGTVTVSHDVSFNKVTGSYTNNNSLTVASGKTLSMSNASTLNQNGGTFTLNGTLTGNLTHNGGTLAFGASSLLNNTNFSYLGGSITGTVNIRSSTLTLGPGTGAASFFMDQTNTLASDIRAGQTITLQSNDSNISLSNSAGFVNNGTIRYTGLGTSGSTTVNSGGTITNSATGLIDFQAADTEAQYLTGDFVNNGTVTVSHDVSFNKVTGSYTNNNSLTVASGKTLSMSNASTLNQNGGTFTLNGTLTGNLTHNGGTLAFGASSLLNNTNFSYLGGSITGTVNIRSSTLTLGPGTGAASFFMDQTNTLASDIRAGQTITLQSNDSNISLSNSAGFVNNGTIRYTGLGTSGSTTVNSGGTITNSATGLIDFQAADTEAQYLTGDFVNNGTVTVSHDVSFNKVTGSYTNNASLVIASGKTLSLTNAGTLTNNSGTTLTGGTYDLAGTLQYGGAAISTNQAQIILRPGGQIINSNVPSDALALNTNGSSGILRLRDGRSLGVGLITFTNQGTIDVGTGSTFSASNLNSSGVLKGTGFIGANVTNSGTVSPGASPGTLTITNNYTQTSTGTLAIEIAGSSNADPLNPQFDVLRDTNTATLGGNLSLTLLGGFVPSYSSSFTILDGNALIGTFANAGAGQRLTTTGGEGSFVVSYPAGTGDVVLSNFALAADYNLNGVVDAADYVRWRKNPSGFGGAGGYNVWRSNFGRTNLPGAGSGANSVSSQTAVPEPSTGLMGLMGLAATIIQCGRKRRSNDD